MSEGGSRAPSYHVFLAGRENFKTCVARGVYGNVEPPKGKRAEEKRAEILASLLAVREGDYVFFYVKNEGFYGLWRVDGEPFYDETAVWTSPRSDPAQRYPYRLLFKPIGRKFPRAVPLSDILDLKDKGKIWTFSLETFSRKNHSIITADEGREIIRLLLRSNPVFHEADEAEDPYRPPRRTPFRLELQTDERGRIRYEGLLNGWFMRSFARGELKDVVGDYRDFLNFVPTSFNTVMDVFLTHVTPVDAVEILHNFTCIELKTGVVEERDLAQVVRYENWLIRKLAGGDAEMVRSVLVGSKFADAVLQYRDKRRLIEEKTVRLIRYEPTERNGIALKEV